MSKLVKVVHEGRTLMFEDYDEAVDYIHNAYIDYAESGIPVPQGQLLISYVEDDHE